LESLADIAVYPAISVNIIAASFLSIGIVKFTQFRMEIKKPHKCRALIIKYFIGLET
jgi:hypothetical protein